jgi:hypothetical protein
VQWIPSTRFGFVDGKQSIEFLDNNILVLWWNGHMYHNEVNHNEVNRLKIRNNFKFARFPVDIVPFPDHSFAVHCDYPRLLCEFPRQNLRRINGYSTPNGYWSTLFTWDRSKRDCLESQQFIYRQLLKRWVHLPHTGHFIQPYRVHSIPAVLVLQRRKQRRIRRFLQKARKAQESWLMKQPKWIKNRQFSF